ncbi:MAG: murein peptide amidase A [Gammaproteobacteria bacterium]|nr:murein peptide amidase A [Gammaproteobacteria bacterium]
MNASVEKNYTFIGKVLPIKVSFILLLVACQQGAMKGNSTAGYHTGEQLSDVPFEFKSFYRVIDENTIQAPLISGPSAKELELTFDTASYNGVRSSGNIDFCDKINKIVPIVTFGHCLHLALTTTGTKSVNGESIFYVDLLSNDALFSRKKVLLLGGIHGDELTSVSSVFYWMSELSKENKDLVDWRIVPLVNPDGFFEDTPTRTNANGVDLNRNLPTPNWHHLATDYWRKFAKRSERKFPGDNPASEPESQWLVQEIDYFKPDIIVTVHAPYNLVDYDAQDRSNAPRSLGILEGKQLGTFPGSLGRYAGEQRNIPVITVELPHSVEMPTELQITDILNDLRVWLKRNIGPKKLV